MQTALKKEMTESFFKKRGLLKEMMMVAMLSATIPHVVSAEEEQSVPVSTSPLLVLLCAKDENSMAIERQFIGELRLTLDTLQVEQVVIERQDFLELTLPEQLAVVQPLIRRFMAKAVLWITVGTSGGRIVQFVVTDRGNATVRTVEAASPEELALAVRELLDTTYLFDSEGNGTSEKKREPRLWVGFLLGLNGGIYGDTGNSSLTGGGGLETRLNIVNGFFIGLTLVGKQGPIQAMADGRIAGWRIEIGLVTGYRFGFGKFEIGPYGEVTAVRSSVNAILGLGEYSGNSWWSFRGALGLEALLRISPLLSVILDWTVGGIPQSRVFKRGSDQSEVLATPMVDYSFLLGLIVGVI
jgi:hypothetical protein